MIAKLNYGLLTINWNQQPLTTTIRINGDNRATYLTQQVTF